MALAADACGTVLIRELCPASVFFVLSLFRLAGRVNSNQEKSEYLGVIQFGCRVLRLRSGPAEPFFLKRS